MPEDTKYGFHMFELTMASCMAWLEAHPPRSMVFVSFGSLSNLDPTKMWEVVHGLLDAGKPFLWVVRSLELHRLPLGYATSCVSPPHDGMVVSWCPQLEVLTHPAIGCLPTHCGWNSTTGALVTGTPMVALPQWTDQPMNAKYMEAVWEASVRVRPAAADRLATWEEVAQGIEEVMRGKRSGDYRRNTAVWLEKARAASREGGSSDRNIAEFVAKYAAVRASPPLPAAYASSASTAGRPCELRLCVGPERAPPPPSAT